MQTKADPVEPANRAVSPAVHNLPRSSSTFVGRKDQISEVVRLVGRFPLVTLLGPTGVGKTRLALEVASRRAGRYSDGVWIVKLAAIKDPSLVPRAVATALRVRERARRLTVETLVDRLQGRRLLIVLDNCEHLIASCAELVNRLLEGCPGVSVLATSQEPLGLGGEAEWRVPALTVPPPAPDMLPGRLAEYESVKLFVDRASRVKPDFSLTTETGPSVAAICRRLDGLPLALELAASRVKVLSPAEIAERLEDRFRLLTTGGRAALPRHKTLRAALDWSHDMLSGPERLLLRRLSVFAGGFVLEAAQDICSGRNLRPERVFDLLDALVNRSLVQTETKGQATRYHMLETIRAYAAERLEETGDVQPLRRRHAEWFTGLAEKAELELAGPAQQEWLDRLEAEHDNFRAVLDWAVSTKNAALALRLAGSLARFWQARSYVREGHERLESALELVGHEPDAVPVDVRAKALFGAALTGAILGIGAKTEERIRHSIELSRRAGVEPPSASLALAGYVSMHLEGPLVAVPVFEQAAVLAREGKDMRSLSASLSGLARAHLFAGDPAAAQETFTEMSGVAAAAGDTRSLTAAVVGQGWAAMAAGDHQRADTLLREAMEWLAGSECDYTRILALGILGELTLLQGDVRAARRLLGESLELARATGAFFLSARALLGLGRTALWEGESRTDGALFDEVLNVTRAEGGKTLVPHALQGAAEVCLAKKELGRAAALLNESYELARELGDKIAIANGLHLLATLKRMDGDHEAALRFGHEALGLRAEVGNPGATADTVELLAGLSAARGKDAAAVRLFAASEALRAANGYRRSPPAQKVWRADLKLLKRRMPDEEFIKAWNAGRSMTLEKMVLQASKGLRRRASGAQAAIGWAALTPIEKEIARLATQGLTNKEIADHQFISPRTVQSHLARIMQKLNVRSRRDLREAVPGRV